VWQKQNYADKWSQMSVLNPLYKLLILQWCCQYLSFLRYTFHQCFDTEFAETKMNDKVQEI